MADDTYKRCPNCGAQNQPDARFCRNCGEPLGAEQPASVEAGASSTVGADRAAALHDTITEITDPLLRMRAASPSDMVVASLQRVLTEAGPRQAEVLRRCAIPRWFDAGVLAVLRERPDGNDRILDLLRGYSFVRQVAEGRYAYHDEVRAALLKEWREQRPDELAAINRRLADYFDALVSETTQTLGVLPKGPPGTTISVAPTGNWELWTREAIYHRLMADPQVGMEQLRTAFERAESAHRLADAEALLQAAHDIPLDENGQRWVRYLRARLERAALRLDEAAEQLGAILAAPALDPLLAAEARRTLGDVWAETGLWARAIELYRSSLGSLEATGRHREAAEVMLRLGEAYHGLGINTGGWHVPAYPQNPFWRALGQGWYWLLGLPFFLIAWVVQRTPWLLPRARHLASYQNWLLARLYRTAQHWYLRARAAFAELGDEDGTLQAEQQLAEILLLFGYVDDALAQLDALRARPAAQDPYRRAWIDCYRAAALLDKGDLAGARALLADALARFKAVGDIRREAAALALQSHAAALSGANDEALAGYRSSLARFRALRYTAAREQVLHALRVWRRSVGPGPLSRRIGEVLAEEPEKRYVARFPRSLLPWLQVLSLAAFPLALLLMALVVPELRVRSVETLLSQTLYYNPWRALGVLAGLVLFYSAAYTLIALAVIMFIPLDALEREQPDYLITDPAGIARYDFHGTRAQFMRWDEVRSWIRLDRRLWLRPLPLFSTTFLEDISDQDLRIDGITGWYLSLQEDIEQHLRQAGNRTTSTDLGFALLRSKSGAALVVGVLLLVLLISAANGWAGWLINALPPYLYAGLSLIAFSGILILVPLAYWFATRPLALQRALGLHDLWPLLVGAAGLGAILIFVFSRGQTIPRPVGIGLLLWGAYVLADATTTLLLPQQRRTRVAIIVIALLGAAAIAIPRASTLYLQTVSDVGASSAQSAPVALAASELLIEQAQTSPEQRAQAYAAQGDAYYRTGNYQAALEAYQQANAIYTTLLSQRDSPELRQAAAAVLYNYAQTLRASNPRSERWQQEILRACQLDPRVAPGCPAPAR